ncbi:hypothetical protein E2C01_102310 [Portunus trituberculatus]|uniref:Uncharacterized protein n=1 Tax=Portunus trituberculatus TaxID=210409 RepID=A0A5B7KI48_PORTR|nr:hypothetical protein [Portunus trituberculatus]
MQTKEKEEEEDRREEEEKCKRVEIDYCTGHQNEMVDDERYQMGGFVMGDAVSPSENVCEIGAILEAFSSHLQR